jgi:hypothetical protein
MVYPHLNGEKIGNALLATIADEWHYQKRNLCYSNNYPLTAYRHRHRLPLTAYRSPLTAYRLPLYRLPLTAHRLPLTVTAYRHRLRLTITAHRLPLTAYGFKISAIVAGQRLSVSR